MNLLFVPSGLTQVKELSRVVASCQTAFLWNTSGKAAVLDAFCMWISSWYLKNFRNFPYGFSICALATAFPR